MKRLKVIEMHRLAGDRTRVMTLEEAKEMDYRIMVTVLPNGRVVHSWEELMSEVEKFNEDEVEIIRFPILVGGQSVDIREMLKRCFQDPIPRIPDDVPPALYPITHCIVAGLKDLQRAIDNPVCLVYAIENFRAALKWCSAKEKESFLRKVEEGWTGVFAEDTDN